MKSRNGERALPAGFHRQHAKAAKGLAPRRRSSPFAFAVFAAKSGKKFDASGEAIRGERTINAAQAAIVVRIFNAYADGRSPKAIVHQLNRDRVPCPGGVAWGASTIHGHRRRGTGILNNELYVGRMVWNRLRYIKDPETGKRVSRLNPEGEWIVKDVPALRIVSQELWERVKARQRTLEATERSAAEEGKDGVAFWDRRRPQYLFSGLLKCGECGGGFVKYSHDRLGCATARNKGTCSNLLTIKRSEVEAVVLNGLQAHLAATASPPSGSGSGTPGTFASSRTSSRRCV